MTRYALAFALTIAFVGNAPAAQYTAVASGGNSKLTLTASITPDTADVGQTVNTYVSARVVNQLYFLDSTGTFTPLVSGMALPVAGKMVAGNGISQSIVSGIDVSNLLGVEIWVGYGKTEADLLTGKYGQVYVINSPDGIGRDVFTGFVGNLTAAGSDTAEPISIADITEFGPDNTEPVAVTL